MLVQQDQSNLVEVGPKFKSEFLNDADQSNFVKAGSTVCVVGAIHSEGDPQEGARTNPAIHLLHSARDNKVILETHAVGTEGRMDRWEKK